MNIGHAIKRRRENAGLSQLELALRMGDVAASPSDISRIENGKQWPSQDKLLAIAAVFRCPVAELFRDDDYPKEKEDHVPTNYSQQEPQVYTLGSEEPNLDRAKEIVDQELNPTDEDTRAKLAVELYSAALAKHNTDRIVSAINSLVMAVESIRER
jgi:transcriptional regulator with XRE-family HTH domain